VPNIAFKRFATPGIREMLLDMGEFMIHSIPFYHSAEFRWVTGEDETETMFFA